MNADSCFSIGWTHRVCQDYAQHGDRFGTFAVVCDGCSSSPDTDFGARLLARAAAEAFPGFDQLESAIDKAAMWAQGIGLPSRAIDATLMLLRKDQDKVRVQVAGDGVVAARRHTGEIDYWEIKFPSGAPLYLSYRRNQERLDLYRVESAYLERYGVRWVTQYRDGKFIQHVGTELLGDCSYPVLVNWFWDHTFDPSEYDLVVAMTDGVESFQKREGTNLVSIPVWNVVQQVMSVKGLTGEFLNRRVKRFLTKFCPDNGWQHYDDFGAAAIAMPPGDSHA